MAYLIICVSTMQNLIYFARRFRMCLLPKYTSPRKLNIIEGNRANPTSMCFCWRTQEESNSYKRFMYNLPFNSTSNYATILLLPFGVLAFLLSPIIHLALNLWYPDLSIFDMDQPQVPSQPAHNPNASWLPFQHLRDYKRIYNIEYYARKRDLLSNLTTRRQICNWNNLISSYPTNTKFDDGERVDSFQLQILPSGWMTLNNAVIMLFRLNPCDFVILKNNTAYATARIMKRLSKASNGAGSYTNLTLPTN